MPPRSAGAVGNSRCLRSRSEWQMHIVPSQEVGVCTKPMWRWFAVKSNDRVSSAGRFDAPGSSPLRPRRAFHARPAIPARRSNAQRRRPGSLCSCSGGFLPERLSSRLRPRALSAYQWNSQFKLVRPITTLGKGKAPPKRGQVTLGGNAPLRVHARYDAESEELNCDESHHSAESHF
jgi:hypothetical protein